ATTGVGVAAFVTDRSACPLTVVSTVRKLFAVLLSKASLDARASAWIGPRTSGWIWTSTVMVRLSLGPRVPNEHPAGSSVFPGVPLLQPMGEVPVTLLTVSPAGRDSWIWTFGAV